MIGSIGSTPSFATTSKPAAPSGQSTFSIDTPAATSAPAESENDRRARELLARLTPDDWAVISASVGQQRGPDENGHIEPLQPMLAWSIASDRANGLTTPISAGYLRGSMGSGQSAAMNNQLGNAIDWVQSGRPKSFHSTWDDFLANRPDVLA